MAEDKNNMSWFLYAMLITVIFGLIYTAYNTMSDDFNEIIVIEDEIPVIYTFREFFANNPAARCDFITNSGELRVFECKRPIADGVDVLYVYIGENNTLEDYFIKYEN